MRMRDHPQEGMLYACADGLRFLVKGNVSNMYKKFLAFFFCVVLGISLVACSGKDSLKKPDSSSDTQDLPDSNSDEQDSPNGKEGADGSQEPLLGEDATDEELLEVLKDDVNVVTDDNYVKTVTALKEQTEKYTGKIYQLEGIYRADGDMPCVFRTLTGGEDGAELGVPLKYVVSDPKDGDWIRVTGVVEEGESEDNPVILEVVILETLEEQGQAELPAN